MLPCVAAEVAKTLIEARISDVQLLVPAAKLPELGTTLEQLLLQPLFGAARPQGMTVTNVFLLYQATDMQQAAAVLDAAVSASNLQQRVMDWSLDMYTVSYAKQQQRQHYLLCVHALCRWRKYILLPSSGSDEATQVQVYACTAAGLCGGISERL
jgi:hypothetical protein